MKKARHLLGMLLLMSLTFFPAYGLSEEMVNINTASEEELLKLPGMTEGGAKAIIRHRQVHGEFIQLEELKVIPLIAPIYDQIKDKVVLE